jgi:hypothetical protein
VAALVSAAIHSQLSGCFSSDCSCPAFPERPKPQAALLIDEADAYTGAGDSDTLPVDPRGGTVELSADELVIRYEHEGMPHEVVYTVEPLD